MMVRSCCQVTLQIWRAPAVVVAVGPVAVAVLPCMAAASFQVRNRAAFLGYRTEVVQVEDHGGPCGLDVVQVVHGEVDHQEQDEMAFPVQPES